MSPAPAPRAPNPGERGSVFLEALIAAAIVAMMLGAFFHTMGEVADRHRLLEGRRAALMVAQSRLATVGSEIPVEAGRSEGVDGDFAWRVDVQPDQADALSTSTAGELARVTVAVRRRAGGGDLATLSSLKLAPPDPSAFGPSAKSPATAAAVSLSAG